MKHTTTIAMFVAPLFLGGCSGAYWGNLIVLAISIGVFYGTLTLGRTSSGTRSEAGDANGAEVSSARSSVPAPRSTT